MKILYNIILIVLLGTMALTTSIFISPVDFSSSIYLENESLDVQEMTKISLTTEDGSYFVNPETLTLKLAFLEKTVFEIPPDHLFNVNIFQDGKLIKGNLKNLEMNYVQIEESSVFNKDDSIIASIDISSDRLSLSPGVYRIIVSASFSDEINSNDLEIAVEYSSAGKYIVSTSNLPANKTGIRMYYANKNNDLLIPVTRFVEYNALKHDLAEELYKETPKENGLRNPVNKINYIISRENIVYIDVPENDPVYASDITEAKDAYFAFLKTMFSIEDTERVRFTVDNLVKETYFNGMDIASSLKYELSSKAYVAVLVDDRYYLTDIDPLKKDDDNIVNIFDSLKNPPYDCISTVPDSVKLNSYNISGNVLSIDLSEEIFSTHTERNDLKNMMTDSLLYSFCSVPGIDYVKITSDGKDVTSYGDYDLRNPLSPNLYINPEE